MRYGPKNLRISFDAKNLTHFGGVYLLHLFFKKLSLRRRLFHSSRFPRRNHRYSVAEEILALIYPICLGIGRIETTHLLKQNGGVPAAHRFARVSSSDYPATIPLSHGSQSLSQTKKTAST